MKEDNKIISNNSISKDDFYRMQIFGRTFKKKEGVFWKCKTNLTNFHLRVQQKVKFLKSGFGTKNLPEKHTILISCIHDCDNVS